MAARKLPILLILLLVCSVGLTAVRAARAPAVLHTAIYDAWAAYDAAAVPTMANGNGRRPAAERTVDNKSKAVSFAAYLALVDLYPARQTIFADKLASLYGADFAFDTTVP